MTLTRIITRLEALRNPVAIAGMARYGIHTDNTFGVSAGELRALAKEIGRDHMLALELWDAGIRETRILAAFVDDPAAVDRAQMERWASAFDSWDVCDGCCIHLFRKTRHAHDMAREWTTRNEEFVKRAGFAMIATLGVHDKKADDAVFVRYLDDIAREADDERNFVKKAVNWALRQIGKRNARLHPHAVAVAEQLALRESRAARWIAKDALRELRGDAVLERVRAKGT
ncbi:MAG: DNA alkylation repair protein [Ignavibacteriae bacterium]|nr:DNA alkylation repair protein [Ignavibacteriota bacterium]